MIIRLKYFHRNLNILVILAFGGEFVLLSVPNFFNILRIKLNEQQLIFTFEMNLMKK